MSTRRLALAAALGCLLAACQSAPARPPAKAIDFSGFAPIVFKAGRVDVVDQTRAAPGRHVETEAPMPPAQAVRLWASQRLQAGGGTGTVRVVVREASLIETPLAKATSGLTGAFTNDQGSRVDGRLTVEVIGDAKDLQNFHGTVQATATRSTTLAEKASSGDRLNALQEVVARMVEDVNARLDGGIRGDLARMITR